MSDISLAGLDALVDGALVALLALLPATALAWWLTRGLAGWRRATAASLAAYGLLALSGAAAALVMQRAGAEGHAAAGTLLAGAALQALAALVLLPLSRKA